MPTFRQRLSRSLLLLSLCLLIQHTVSAAEKPQPSILVYGDSLSASFAIEQQLGWVNLLQLKLQDEGYTYQVINLSISGETSQGGISRLPGVLSRYSPQIFILALGANDGLRGGSLKQMQINLTKIITQAKQKDIEVLLVGMQLPPNYGQHYNQNFQAIFNRIAKQQQLAFVPFLLEKMANNRDLFQRDGLHPTAEAQALILDVIWPKLRPML